MSTGRRDESDSVVRAIAAAPPVAPPKVFRGSARFALQRRLGEGAGGVVHEAIDRETGARVALKVLKRPTADWLYRFKREFRALADIHHPNLVARHELIAEGEHWFITMELVDGTGFIDHVRGGDPAEIHDRLRAALPGLVHGVCALHDAGKLHRDIKPSNVLVTRDGRVVLLDFGLIAEGAGDSSIVGTPGYMSPEQAAGEPMTPAGDWYAVGVMIHEALTGRRPPAPGSTDAVAACAAPLDLARLCRELLRPAPAARPCGRRVLERLGFTGQPAPSPSAAAFVGRDAQLEALRSAVDACARGPVCAVVHGASGIGKTALVDRFLAEVADRVAPVILGGRCYERETVPYKALDGIVDALSRRLRALPPDRAAALVPPDIAALARLFPVLQSLRDLVPFPADPGVASVAEIRHRASRALRSLLHRIAGDRPLILWIDDFQWADREGSWLLEELLRAWASPGLLLLLGCRGGEPATSLRELLETIGRGSPPCYIAVGPLSSDEARLLALATLGERAAGRADEVARESAGCPLFVAQLARYTGGDQPATLDQLLLARKAQLPAAAQRLLEIVAIAGRPIPESVACQAAGLDRSSPAVTAVRVERLVAGAGGAVETTHDRIRETVVASLGPEPLRRAHLALARALEATGAGDAEELAQHLDGAGLPAQAATHAAAAAAAAADALAFEHSAELYRFALARIAPTDPAARTLDTALAEALANAGRYAESAEVLLAASRHRRGTARLDLSRLAVERFFLGGHVDRGLAVARDVVRAVGLRFPTTTWGMLASIAVHRTRLAIRGYGFAERPSDQIAPRHRVMLDVCRSMTLGLGLIDPLRAFDYSSRFALHALRSGEPGRVVQALCSEAERLAGLRPGDRRTTELLDRGEQLGRQLGDPSLLCMVKQVAADAACFRGELPAALELAAEAEALLHGNFVEGPYGRSVNDFVRLTALWWSGATAEVARWLPEVISDAQRRGDRLVPATLLSVASRLSLLRDDPERAGRELDAALAAWTRRGFTLQHLLALLARVDAHLYSGQPAIAIGRLRTSWPLLHRSGMTRQVLLGAWTFDARARASIALAARAGDPDLLIAAERDIERLERTATGWSALAPPLRAAIAAARGDLAAARARLTGAVPVLEAVGLAIHAQVARLRLGQLTAGSTGQEIARAAAAALRDRLVARPDRLADVLLPGFTSDRVVAGR